MCQTNVHCKNLVRTLGLSADGTGLGISFLLLYNNVGCSMMCKHGNNMVIRYVQEWYGCCSNVLKCTIRYDFHLFIVQ